MNSCLCDHSLDAPSQLRACKDVMTPEPGSQKAGGAYQQKEMDFAASVRITRTSYPEIIQSHQATSALTRQRYGQLLQLPQVTPLQGQAPLQKEAAPFQTAQDQALEPGAARPDLHTQKVPHRQQPRLRAAVRPPLYSPPARQRE